MLGILHFFYLPPSWGKVAARCEAAPCGRKGGRAALSKCLAAFALLIALIAFTPTHAADTLTQTSIPDSTYGDGGTKQTILDSQNTLKGEVWRDATGMIREQHEVEPSGEQFFGFFIGEGTAAYNWGGAIAIKPISGPTGAYTMTIYGTGTVTIKEYGFLTKAELDTEFAYWRSQMRGWVNGFISPKQGSG